MFSDEENETLRELGQKVIVSMLEVVALILISRIWNSAVSRSRFADRLTLAHNDFEPVKMFTGSLVRRQFQYSPPVVATEPLEDKVEDKVEDEDEDS